MGIGVAFKVAVAVIFRDQLTQFGQHIPGDIGVGIFINGQGRGCVGDEDGAESAAYICGF